MGRAAIGGVLFGLAMVVQAHAVALVDLPGRAWAGENARPLAIQVAVNPPHSSMLWLVVSSRPTYDEAAVVAQSFSYTLGPTAIIQTRNGVFAVVAGTLYDDKAKSNLKTLKALRLIPDDSFLSVGTNFFVIASHNFGDTTSTDLMTQPAYLQTVRRMQAALKEMNLYDGAADGLIGPSTVKSFDAYLSAYDGPVGDFLDGSYLAVMEGNAHDGFRSQADRRMARSMGFGTATSYAEASRGGFTSPDIFDKARGLGFSTQRDYQAAQSGGFRNADEFGRARSGGFTSAYDYYAAQNAGLANQAEYVGFRSSGFSEASAYRAARAAGFSDKRSFDEALSAGFKTKEELDRAKSRGAADRASYEKLLAQELESARASAKTLLTDADMFLRLNPTAPNLIEIADKAASLGATMQNGSTETLQQASSKLTTQLAAVPGYGEFAAKRDQERAQKLAELKAEIRKHLEARRTQLTKWMSANIASPKLPEVVGELKLLSDAVGSDKIETLATARESIEALIVRQSLEAELAKLGLPEAQKAGSPNPTESAQKPSEPAPFEVTPANEALLRGHLDAVVVLQNAGSNAPSLIRNLNGDYSFTDASATVCTLGVEPTPSLQRGLLESLRPMGADRLLLTVGSCDAEEIALVDLLLVSRKTFLESDTELATAFLDAMNLGELKLFAALDFAKVQAKQKDEDALSATIATDLRNGTRSGYGALQLPVAKGAICAVIEGGPSEHAGFIEQAAGFAGMKATPATIKTGALDLIYQDLRRDRCKLFYASANDLKQVSQAYERDGLGFTVLPVWFDTVTVGKEAERLTALKAEEIRKVEAARLAREAEAQAQERRRKEKAEERVAREAALRKDNGAAAAAAMNKFVDGLKLAVLRDASGLSKDQADLALSVNGLYPSFAQWQAQMQQEAWRPLSVDTNVNDFGSVTWKGRNLDAVVIETRIKLSNSELGEYKQECFLLGAVIDDEFSMMRDAVETRCDGATDQMAVWKTGHELKSQWVAE